MLNNNLVQKELDVKGNKIGVVIVNGEEYISLTDLARCKNSDNPGDIIIK